MKKTETILTRGPAETHRFAAALAAELRPGAVLALHGDLGAGKTCLVQGLACALGIRGAVNSPTFTLINEHGGGRLPLYHIDLYRINGPAEALGLGLDDYLLGQGITAIEWAERIAPLLPRTTIHIRLEAGAAPDERRITIERENAP